MSNFYPVYLLRIEISYETQFKGYQVQYDKTLVVCNICFNLQSLLKG